MRRPCRAQKFAHPGEVLRFNVAGQQAVVADEVEVLGQDVQQESVDESVVVKGHGLLPTGPFDLVALLLNVTLRSSQAISRQLEMATRCVWRER